MKYSFDVFKKEQIRAVWLSGFFNDEELEEKYYQKYKEFCVSHGLEYEPDTEEMYNRISGVIENNWGYELAEKLYHKICNITWYADGKKDTKAVRELYNEFRNEIES